MNNNSTENVKKQYHMELDAILGTSGPSAGGSESQQNLKKRFNVALLKDSNDQAIAQKQGEEINSTFDQIHTELNVSFYRHNCSTFLKTVFIFHLEQAIFLTQFKWISLLILLNFYCIQLVNFHFYSCLTVLLQKTFLMIFC